MPISSRSIPQLAAVVFVSLAAVLPAAAMEEGHWLEHLDRTHTWIDPRQHVESYGEIVSIDAARRSLTLQHVAFESPDRSIKMPVMTMDFRATSQSKLNRLKVGDWVSFEAVRQRGALVVTDIRRVGVEGSRSNMLLW